MDSKVRAELLEEKLRLEKKARRAIAKNTLSDNVSDLRDRFIPTMRNLYYSTDLTWKEEAVLYVLGKIFAMVTKWRSNVYRDYYNVIAELNNIRGALGMWEEDNGEGGSSASILPW